MWWYFLVWSLGVVVGAIACLLSFIYAFMRAGFKVRRDGYRLVFSYDETKAEAGD